MKKEFLNGGNDVVALVDMDYVHEKGGRVVVVSDIHGNLDAFCRFLNDNQVTMDDLIVFNGDAIDRGPEGVALLRWAKNTPNVLFLKGNHEELMLDALEEMQYRENGPKMRCWIGNGGQPTLDGLCQLSKKEYVELIDWVKHSPYVAIVQSYRWQHVTYVTHANLSQKSMECVVKGKIPYFWENGVELNALTWERPERLTNEVGGILITGHTSTHYYGAPKGEAIFDCYCNRAIIDCATFRTNKVGYVNLLVGERIQFGSC